MDAVWDIISNKEAIEVNQQWAGQPGRLVTSAPAYQVWAKQLPQGDVAVLIFNRGAGPVDVNLSASSIAPSLFDFSQAYFACTIYTFPILCCVMPGYSQCHIT